MNEIKIPENIFNEIIKILTELPYNRVAHVMQQIANLLKDQEIKK